MRLVQIIRHAEVIRPVNPRLRLGRARRADLRVALLERGAPGGQGALVGRVRRVRLGRQVVGQRGGVDGLVVLAGGAEDLLLVGGGGGGGGFGWRLVGGRGGGGGGGVVRRVEDVAAGVEVVGCFAGGALEGGRRGGEFGVRRAGAAEVAGDAGEGEEGGEERGHLRGWRSWSVDWLPGCGLVVRWFVSELEDLS